MKLNKLTQSILLASMTVLACAPSSSFASSHREAPFITETPKVDGTDFYLFNSYESGREGFVTLIANYQPLQDAFGGPNYFTMDPEALYEIHIDNNADAREDITFQFRFDNQLQDITLDIGGKSVSIPLINSGAIGPFLDDNANLNVTESYTVTMIKGDRRRGSKSRITHAQTGAATFVKPVDNIGDKSIPEYAAYAQDHIFPVNIPACGEGRLFVGQRTESFVVNLGEIFDLVNTNPLGPVDGESNTIGNKNITTLALEVPTDCLTADSSIIGGWTTASKRVKTALRVKPSFNKPAIQVGGFRQVSRLGSPLVNEVVIGVKDKNLFNASEPKRDAQFAEYVTNPTLPALLELLFDVPAPTLFPRVDLVAVFLTGIEGLTLVEGVQPSEMLRLNTAIEAVAIGAQNNLGVLGGDLAGFPNGRRPGDDVVDISLRAVMGVLLEEADAPAGQLPFTDGAIVDSNDFDAVFPYLTTPVPGAVAE